MSLIGIYQKLIQTVPQKTQEETGEAQKAEMRMRNLSNDWLIGKNETT